MTNRIDIITSDDLNDLKRHILELSKKGFRIIDVVGPIVMENREMDKIVELFRD